MITVTEITAMSDEIQNTMAHLVPQLSASAKLPAREEIEDIITSKASILLAARDSDDPAGKILGCLTLVVFRIPTGIRAWVEDVVVDSAARGKGVGETLVKAALQRAGEEGAITVDLTSRPSREAANRLYRRCGFEQRETNIYRFKLKKDLPGE